MVASYHKLSSLNTHLLSHSSLGQRVWVGWAGSSTTNFTRLFRYLCWQACVPLWSLWGRICLQVYSGCWQNSTPCGCRTENTIYLLAASQLWSPPRSCLNSFSCFLNGFLQQLWVEFFSCFKSDVLSATPLCCHSLLRCLSEKFFCF